MLAPNNFLSPATGDPILTPSQDMVLGCYYLTANNPTQQSQKDQYFSNFDDVLVAYQQSVTSLHTFVWVRSETSLEDYNLSKEFIVTKVDNRIIYSKSDIQLKKDLVDNTLTKYVRTTPGRIILNKAFE
jgi:DNA-directed RNA polymerase subunit beta'